MLDSHFIDDLTMILLSNDEGFKINSGRQAINIEDGDNKFSMSYNHDGGRCRR